MKLRFKQKFHGKARKISIFIFLILAFSTVFFGFLQESNYINNSSEDHDESNHTNEITPKISAKWYLILTNYVINNTCHYHNDTIPIIGKLYYINNTGIPGYTISVIVDEIFEYPKFNDTTDVNGEFHINFTIPYSMNIYQTHKIQVKIIESTPATIQKKNHFIISTNSTSDFDLEIFTKNIPQLAGGTINLPGYLRYDNNSGIPNAFVDYYWYNDTNPQEKWDLDNINTLPDGSFQIPLPSDDNLSNIIHLNLTYMGIPDLIESSQKNISVNLYRNITCIWNTVSSATAGNQINISGQLVARSNSNLKINSTEIKLMMSGASIGTAITKDDGTFTLIYTIPSGTSGSKIVEVELLNYPDINSNNTHLLNIAAAPVTPSDDINGGGSGDTPPPFQNFFMVLIPIIIGGVAGFAVFAYFYLKKQEEESKVMKVPLEGRIRNLKILKETGRMEESLSYLFQSIYMELINGKYGRRITETETIRDFAIISVKNLNLNPATIYPFIQKVEEIIYARPFIINDKDFYETVELFSPIYFELTGYNFVLNF